MASPPGPFRARTQIPYQVVNAQQQGLDAPRRVGVPGRADGQEAPQELGQELQREALQLRLAAPVKLKELVADWFQQLRTKAAIKKRKKKKKNGETLAPNREEIIRGPLGARQ